MLNEHDRDEHFAANFLSKEHLAQLALAEPLAASLVLLHGACDPAKPLFAHKEREAFIAEVDRVHPGDEEPTMLAKVRRNCFLPLERGSTLFVGQ